jgi:hypothetical protein
MSTIPQRRSRTEEYDLEEDDSYYETRLPTSTRRCHDTRGNQVIEKGNRRIVVHQQPPPAHKLHWSFILGIGMLFMLALWVLGSYALNWWNNHELDSTYGMPRTAQYDQVVGHMDSIDHPTHFLAINLRGKITIIELPGGSSLHARIYSGPALVTGSGDSIPITLEFADTTGDGKLDMIVHIGDQKIMYLNDGTQFKPQQ